MADITGVTAAEIKNQALFLLGFPDEIDFTVLTNPTVKKVNRIYDTTLLNVLSDYRWRFTITRVELGQTQTDTFTVVAGTDILTSTGISFEDNHKVTLTTTAVSPTIAILPDPLETGTTYYTVSSTGLTCKLSATLGGSAIDITDTGTGTHSISYLGYEVADDTYKFNNLFTLPSDMLTFNNAFHDSSYYSAIRQFETNQTYLNTDETEAYLAYNALVAETEFPQYFINYYRYKLAMDLCFNLTGDTDLLKVLAMQANDAFIRAKRIDARQSPTRTVKSSPFTQIRN